MPASNRRGRCDRGSSVPLIIGLVGVIVLLIAVVVDATAGFLDRSRLETLADGAALQGADGGATGDDVYAGTSARRLAPTTALARRAVSAYLAGLGAPSTYPGLVQRVSVDSASRTVSVSLCAQVDLPLGVPGLARSATICAASRAAVTRDE